MSKRERDEGSWILRKGKYEERYERRSLGENVSGKRYLLEQYPNDVVA